MADFHWLTLFRTLTVESPINRYLAMMFSVTEEIKLAFSLHMPHIHSFHPVFY